MRYLTLAEVLAVAEAVTGTDATTLARLSRVELLDSALHAPQAGVAEIAMQPGTARPTERVYYGLNSPLRTSSDTREWR